MLRKERGSNLLEMAIVFPVLLLLLAGVADVGRGFHAYILITGALRDGARYAAQFPSQHALIEDRILLRASESGITLLRSNIGVTRIYGVGADQAMRVTAAHPMNLILGSLLGFSSITIRSYAEMPVVDPER